MKPGFEVRSQLEFELLGGIPLTTSPHKAVLRAIADNVSKSRDPRYICITNTESMYYARRIGEHAAYVRSAAFSLCDGVGVVLAGRARGLKIPRFNGPQLVDEACEFGQDLGWRHFFCGGRPGVAERMVERLRARYPRMIVAGTFVPPFRDLGLDEEAEMIQTIRAAEPDIVWVGLGLLKQEAWIARYRVALGVPWAVGVGAAFDYHAGTARWAPPIFRRLGLEWLYRLLHEPRMFVRNVRSAVFLLESVLRIR